MSQALFDQVESLKVNIEKAEVHSADALEAFRIKYLGSKNILKPLFGEIRNIENERKKEFGQLLNQVKSIAETNLPSSLSGKCFQ